MTEPERTMENNGRQAQEPDIIPGAMPDERELRAAEKASRRALGQSKPGKMR